MRLIEAELVVLALSYLLAAIPVGGVALAGSMSPLYKRPAADYLRWWSWGALLVAASALLVSLP